MAELTPDENAGAIRGGCVQAGHRRLVGTLGTWQGGTGKGEIFFSHFEKKKLIIITTTTTKVVT